MTGTFTYGADTSWRGLILVVGKGIFTSTSSGSGEIHGGLLIARLFDAGNTPLVAGAPLGAATFNMTGAGGGNGLRYSSCWIQASHPSLSYKVLSFREISQ